MKLGWLISSKWSVILLILAFATKAVLMTLAPMSPDLAFQVSQGFGMEPWSMTPYGLLFRSILALWNLTPLEHPNLASSWTVNNFQPSPSLFLLVFMLKFPLLILDFVTGILIGECVRQQGFVKQGKYAFFVWFLNPYVLLVNEMWWSMYLFPIALLLSSVIALRSGRRLKSDFYLLCATAAKLFPLISAPAFFATIDDKKQRLIAILSALVGAALFFAWTYYAGYNPLLQFTRYDVFFVFFDEFTVSTQDYIRIGLATTLLTVTYVLMLEKWPKNPEATFDGILVTFLAYFAFANWFPSYLLWLIPFATVRTAGSRRGLIYLALLTMTAFSTSIFTFKSYFTANGLALFFLPVNGNALLMQTLASYNQISQNALLAIFFVPLAQALFTSICLIYAAQLINTHTKILTTLSRCIGI